MKKQTLFLMGMAAAVVTLTGCSSNEGSEQVTRKSRTLTITQSAVQQKSILVDQGENGLNATWEMGDQMTVYNQSYPAAGYATVKASASTKNTNFVGKVDCQAGDVLRLFYPKVSESGSVTDATNNGTLTLNISNQKGTLEDIQQHFDFNYGQATVTAVDEETATANAGTTENLMAICKFTFKSEGSYLKKISSVKISGVPTTATFTLSASSTPALTPATNASTINISADGMDNAVYVALFPGETTPTFTLTAGESTYEGTLTASTLKAGKFYNSAVVKATKTGDAPAADYVEVCGTKWAKGNLWYDPVNGGDEGFQENWRIAPNQWEWIGYDKEVIGTLDGYKGSYIDNRGERIRDFFQYGALSITEIQSHQFSFSDDISGKFFAYTLNTSNQITNLTEVPREYAMFGDIVADVSNGKYRLPSKLDVDRLLFSANFQIGYYVSPSGKKVGGILFTSPQGERIIDRTNLVEFTSDDLERGLFLPCANSASAANKYNGWVLTVPSAMRDNSDYIGGEIYYCDGWKCIRYHLDYYKGKVQMTFEWPYTYSAKDNNTYYKIRPVLNE